MNKITSHEKRQLLSLKNNKFFINCFKKLILNSELTFEEAQYILSSSIIFFRYYNNDKRLKGYFNIAYYIVLKYSLLHKNYKPLYDISLQIGFYPISNFIIKNELLEEKNLHEAIINNEVKKIYSKEHYVETVEQHNRTREIFKNIKTIDTAYIAPTSFGKSSIIRDVIVQNEYSKIVIIVPTKSLIVQTYNDIRKLELAYKLILHDEMYNNEDKFIGILTQERATRLINKFDLAFDIMFIDEAHNLLNNNSRNFLLSRLVMLNYKKNNKHRLLYLSPLVSDISNLKIKNTNKGQIFESTIKHNLKTFDTFYLDKKGKLYSYNRYTGEQYLLNSALTFVDYIITNSKNKNFLYTYRPKIVEKIAEKINSKIGKVSDDLNLKKISNVIAEEVSEDIDLVKYILNGVIYLHGKLPNILKEYLEYNYKEVQGFKYVIANSVILEGINFPIDNLYITSTYGLTVKGLNNLIGRVNRLNYVFNDNLQKLISEVHFVDSDEYTDSRSNMINKLALLREHTFKDENKNPLLEEYNIEELKIPKKNKENRKEKDKQLINATEFLINIKPINLSDKIKQHFIENNIDAFYKNYEDIIPTIIDNTLMISNSSDVINTIYEVFINNLENEITDFELERLKNVKARSYYKNYIDIFQLLSLKEKIANTLTYFQEKAKDTFDTFLFIGASFGEVALQSNKYQNFEYLNKVYINLKGKSKQQLANLSLVKIKLEEDFVSFKLKKLITFLYDFEFISEETYLLAVYGSSDKDLINLTRIGLNPSISKILKENNQLTNLELDPYGNLKSNDTFKDFLKTQNELFNFEINKYIR
ncbi:DEAD/DEAH box helicase [Olleya marilimosa]|uniref:DEAD/DEAH box helicase n=1 Tax=Olleya marilimosa TaxID=272164 RepID=UPI0030EB85AC|tara:strand:- start:36321 stop:38771 length:2451 start_codon:yes stop_codon:yes gene_type:complete